MVLINKIDTGTFSPQEASLPVWTGPSSTTIWIQTLAYASLSMSLLVAFGGVLGKQWLGHFKTSRFGRGALHERCQRRQRKLDGLVLWRLSTIIATLPMLLQLSLLFFGISLAANVWTQQHTVASVIIAATSFGALFYSFTIVTSLRSPDSPFQTPVSTILLHVLHFFRALPVHVSYAGILNGLQSSLRDCFEAGKQLITRLIILFLRWTTSVLWQTTPSRVDDPELAGPSELTDSPFPTDYPLLPNALDLSDVESHVDLVQIHSIQWILEISTDTDIIADAVKMIPDIEWPDEYDSITTMLDRLTSHLHSCFDSARQITPLTQERAIACLKALFHFWFERDMSYSITISYDTIEFMNDDGPYRMIRDQDFLLIFSAVRSDEPSELHIGSLSSSDRMWLAHMLTYQLHAGDKNTIFLTFVIRFVDVCLQDPKSPPRLVADCLVLTGMMMGLPIDRSHLARLDKR
jgi:Family of unknown function (DUF6535)